MLASLNGATRIHVTIGDPIAQVKSPAGITSGFHARGHDAIMIPLQVKPADIENFLALAKKLPNLDGIIITVPHKPVAFRHCDTTSERADHEPGGPGFAALRKQRRFLVGVREDAPALLDVVEVSRRQMRQKMQPLRLRQAGPDGDKGRVEIRRGLECPCGDPRRRSAIPPARSSLMVSADRSVRSRNTVPSR